MTEEKNFEKIREDIIDSLDYKIIKYVIASDYINK